MFLFKKIAGPLLLPVSVGLEVMLPGLFVLGSALASCMEEKLMVILGIWDED